MDFDFDHAVLGGDLSPELDRALRDAATHRADPPRAAAALKSAESISPDHPAVLIALYRDHFYGHRLAPARDIAGRALCVGARALGLPESWRAVPRTALPGARTDATTRFYLFALKGLAYLSLRLGDLQQAGEALALMRDLDPDDCVGAALLEAVRLRRLRELAKRAADDAADDDGTLPVVFGAAAWQQLDLLAMPPSP